MKNLGFSCPLCNPDYSVPGETNDVDCQRCGQFTITRTAAQKVKGLSESDRVKLIISTATNSVRGMTIAIDTAEIDRILSRHVRASVSSMENNALTLIAERMGRLGELIKVRKEVDFPQVGAEGPEEFGQILRALHEDKKLDWRHKTYSGMDGLTELRLSTKGWKEREKLNDPNSAPINRTNAPEVPGWKTLVRLGGGGQGSAFKVVASDNEAQIGVLKVLRSDRSTPKAKARMEQEIKATQLCQNHHVIKILEHGIFQDEPYYISEYCEHGNLDDWVKSAPQSHDQVLSIFQGVCKGVMAMHELHVIHRDLKPENILLKGSPQFPVVGDFGICHVENGASHTSIHERVGPRDYMAPELENPVGNVEPRETADIYSLGKVLYFMFKGHIFSREDFKLPGWNLAMLLGKKFEAINRIFEKTIVYSPDLRYQTVGELLSEVGHVAKVFGGNMNIIHPDVDQSCIYCGRGTYKEVFDTVKRKRINNETRRDSRIFFLKHFMTYPGGSPQPDANMDWKVLRCDYCGNIQVFWPTTDGTEGTEVENRWYPKKSAR